jgi:hypothetical protein
MWPWIGAALAAAGALAGVHNARAKTPNAVAREEYGLTARSHARFAAVSAAFCLAFACGAFVPQVPVLALMALYVLLFVLYASSFARGFSER